MTRSRSKKGKSQNLRVHVAEEAPNCPRRAAVGDVLTVHYFGFVRELKEKFDSSYERKKPLTFRLGKGQVIKAWDRGLVGMCVGEIRVLEVPPELGYGSNGLGNTVPPMANLVFQVELLDLKRSDQKKNEF
ncbi:unnamed protein product [Cyprideis torosa]|uniref:peptidylprolyl isomerase n=1 Tax=Cyprideis torosa TaxID=163714 RepID=A0A7R8ZT15_9CRUS|nr:unnamed protein product [Cyprideis torosa]CAG0896939.1 unnamed protein product [Cyprideis torosa]